MTGRRLLPAAVALAGGLALAACGTPATPVAPDGGAFTGPGPADFYPTRTAFGSHPPPEAPACLRSPEDGFPSARAFADCRRDLEVYELALTLWSERLADLVGEESRRKHEHARAAFTCRLGGDEPCAPVGYGVELVSQPRPPACVGDTLPLAVDGGGVQLENCRYGVARYRDNLTKWARRIAYDARLEADARLETAIERFNCKLLAAPYRGVPCFVEPPTTGRYAFR